MGGMQLSERLTEPVLARLKAHLLPGSQAALALLADESEFLDPSASELPATPAPDQAAQKWMLDAARNYVAQNLPRLPNFLATQGLTGRFYPRLMSRYAPDNTIITHCPYHRKSYGTDAAQQMDIVLRLNGKTDKANVAPMATPDSATGVSPWVAQK